MSQPYDVATKDLIEEAAADWVAFLGGTTDPARVSVIDADVATVSAAADKVIRVADAEPWLLHLELQASWDGGLPRRVLLYNAVLHHRHEIPVASAVVLLRPEANAAAVTGRLAFAPPVGPGWAFGYTVLRLWEVPAERLLTGPLGTLPLAPLADITPAELPAVVRRVGDRLRREAAPPTARKLWATSYILMGMRYEQALIDLVTEGVMDLSESVTYQAILRKGEARGREAAARAVLLRMGRKKFGPPPRAVEETIAVVTDLSRLEALADRLLDVATWDELLADG